MKQLTITLTGTAPILMHNARLSDPLDPATKNLSKLAAKRSKTEDDHLAVARAEYIGGLYYDDDFGPYLPAQNIEAALKKGSFVVAKISKDKMTAGFRITSMENPLAYSGPRDIESLWADGGGSFSHRASVKVGQSRVMRTRPIFREWALELDAIYDENVMDLHQLDSILGYAGSMVGLGDWRPRFGTFTHEIQEH